MRLTERMLAFGAVLISAGCAVDGAGLDERPAGAARGRMIAESACAECHAIARDDLASPNDLAPPFQALADRPDVTSASFALLLRMPHRSMPNFIVPAQDVEDLAAYLATLRS